MLSKKSTPNKKSFLIVFGIIFALGLVLRLYDLDVKPLHFDEGVHWNHFIRPIVEGGTPKYSAHFHGFTSWHLSAIPLYFLEPTPTTIRFMVALAGALVVALWWFLRSYIGRMGMLISGLFVALSPTLIFYGRHAAQHTYFILFLLASVLLMSAFIRSLKERYFYLWTIVMALLYTTHEFALVFIAILVSFVAMMFYFAVDATDIQSHLKRIARALRPHVVILGALLFIFFVSAIMSSFFTNMDNLRQFIVHQVSPFEFEKSFNTGHNKPFFYYVTLFLPIEIFAFLGTVLAFVFFRRTYFAQFVLYWTLASFFVFSMIPYKIPWLFVIVLIPMYILSGLTVEELIRRIGGSWRSHVAFVFVVASLAGYYGYQTIRYNYVSPTAYAKENPLNYVGPVDDSYRLIADLELLMAQLDRPRILLGTEGAPAFEYYLRDENLRMIPDDDMDLAPYYNYYDVFIVHPTATFNGELVREIGYYETRERYFVRVLVSNRISQQIDISPMSR